MKPMWKQKTAAVVISAGMAAACLDFPCAAEEQELTVMPIAGEVTEELAEPIAVNSLTREEGSLLPVRKIAEHFGYDATFWTMASIHVVGLASFALLTRKRYNGLNVKTI